MINRRSFIETAFQSAGVVGLFGLSFGGCAYQELTALVPGSALPFVTPMGEHYMKNGAEGSIRGWGIPNIDAQAWTLRIDGLVSQPLELGIEDLLAEPHIPVLKTMQCVVDSNGPQGLVGTAVWAGVPIRTFLDRAGIDLSRAVRVHMHGADGFTGNIPIGRIYDPEQHVGLVEPLLVTHMNGQPLPRNHGGPCRVLVHDGFGYACVKWVTRLEVTVDDSDFGTYQDAGFTDEARTPVFSKVTAPTDNFQVDAGVITCHGFAISGAAPIAAVEVRVNGGEWFGADIAARESVMVASPEAASAVQFTAPEQFSWPLRGVWALWSFSFEAGPGSHKSEVRAIDELGATQEARDLDISDGVSSYASVRVKAS